MASSSSSSKSWKYDVFLSFRGEDTRKTFVDHLYYALEQHGILTYKDDVTLDRGEIIGPSLMKAIELSRISVIIFSENYADSSWCLDELSYIMKCKDSETEKIVFPIFYHVDPSDVRNQKGQFGKAFAKAKHKLSKNKKEKAESWKNALVDATNIAGWEPKHVANGHEAKCIKEIVGSILDRLSSSDSTIEDENLIGMGIRLKQLKSRVRIELGGVRMVGIWGLGGCGKTTLATSLYKECSPNFVGCCFLGNIREETKQHGLKSLQEKILSTICHKQMQVESIELGKDMIKRMLCHRKVLIVLDDVDHLDQLKALAGCRKWFGDGSRIIITTRDQHLLTTHRVDEVSPINLLSRKEAVRLFRKHAYHEDNPIQDYEKLSQRIVYYAAGLPLALIVLGSFLYDKDKDEWLSTLDRLTHHPEMDIVEKLKISYDGLKHVEKELFLDIACLFRGKKKEKVMKILDAYGFYPTIGVKVLIQKALITVSNNGKYDRFDMHDLVQEMAHYIVRGEHPNNPEKHSRIWREEDIIDMCSRNATMENDKIEAIHPGVNLPKSMFLLNMKKLRFLQVRGFFDEESVIPKTFQAPKLVFLEVSSWQKELWKGYKYLPSLKELHLVYSDDLLITPDISGLPCLQKLIICGCQMLREIHPSLGNHNSLVYVDVNSCELLTRFPRIVRMDKLKILAIYNCFSLDEFPKIEAKMDSLIELSLYDVGIEVLPSSVGKYCTNLIKLELFYCNALQSIEGDFHALKCLKEFTLHFSNLYHFSCIQQLITLPRCLRKLDLYNCHLRDGEIPKEVGEYLSSLQELHLHWNYFTRLDFGLSRLTSLKLLDLNWNKYLVELPELPSSLAILRADGCDSLEVIKDDTYINCKCLCNVSIKEGEEDIDGMEELIETMLQGNSVESGCISLLQNGFQITRGVFDRPLFLGRKCGMPQLPENWYNDFSGFLFFTASTHFDKHQKILLRHGKFAPIEPTNKYYKSDSSVSEDDLMAYLKKSKCIWVGYISFGLLRNMLWWDQTSTVIDLEFEIPKQSDRKIGLCGCKLVPKRSETTDSSSYSSSDDVSDDYTCGLNILRDSKSTLECYIEDHQSR